MVYSYMLLIYCYTLYYMYNHLLCRLLLRRPVVIFYTHSPASSPIVMLNVLCFLSCISTNDVNLYVHSIYEFSTTCAGSINNVLPFKSVELAQSYIFMSFAILTKICINDTQK